MACKPYGLLHAQALQCSVSCVPATSLAQVSQPHAEANARAKSVADQHHLDLQDCEAEHGLPQSVLDRAALKPSSEVVGVGGFGKVYGTRDPQVSTASSFAHLLRIAPPPYVHGCTPASCPATMPGSVGLTHRLQPA